MPKQSFLLLIVTLMLVACATTPKAPRDARSDNFKVTARYLDLGGDVYTYMDIDGDVAAAAGILNEMVAVIDEIPPAYKARIDTVKIAKSLGLTDIQAVGMSSYKSGERYINKSFTKTVYPRTGLMRYFGGEPHPFEILELAPANAIVAYESDINLQAFLDTLYAVLKDVADQNIVADVDQHLDSPIVEGGMTYRGLIERLDTKIMGTIALHPTRRMKIPDTEIEIPVIEALFVVDNMGPLMDILVSKAGEVPVFSIWEDAEWQRIGAAEFLTKEMLDYRPVIWRHKATQRLYIATSSAFLEERLTRKNGLATSAVFTSLSASIPVDQGNGLIYVSPDVYNTIIDSVDKALAKEPKLASLRKVIDVLSSKVSPGMVWTSQNTHDGIYQVSSSSFSHKLTLLGSFYINQLYGITMLAAAGEFAMKEAFRNVFPSESAQPESPMYPEIPPDVLPPGTEDTPQSDLEKKLDEQQNGAPAPEPEKMPDFVEKFLKQWQQDHPGDQI